MPHRIVEDLTPDDYQRQKAAGCVSGACPFVGRNNAGQLVIVGAHVPKHTYRELRGKTSDGEVVVEISESLLDELIRQRRG